MDLSRAVSSTIAYASYFKFPLYPREIHHWLICSTTVAYEKLHTFLPSGLSKKDRLLRTQTTRYSEQKKSHAQKLIKVLKFLPGLLFVGLTGSVAANNSMKDDDIDLLFITSPHALWLVRPWAIFLISLFFRRRHPLEDHAHSPDAFCPNLWLDTLSLNIPESKRSLYTAHEILQIIPLLDRGGTYHLLLKSNSWAKKYLANAYNSNIELSASFRAKEFTRLGGRNLTPPTSVIARSKATWQSIPFLFILAPLNYLFYLIQLLYMYPKKTSETVHLHAAFLHATDFSLMIDQHLEDLDVI